MSKTFPPKFEAPSFTCPLCGVLATQAWNHWVINRYNAPDIRIGISSSTCFNCKKRSFWHRDVLIVPQAATAPLPHIETPDDCRVVYLEARDIADRSPKAAAALIRRTIEMLMPHLGEGGKSLNDAIGSLVAKGLPTEIANALDICRVVGNNALHPLEMNLDEDPETAHALFDLVNAIVEDRIARPKKLQALYAKLPEGARTAIERRDAPKLIGPPQDAE